MTLATPQTQTAPWIATKYQNRFMVTAVNTTGVDLDDALVEVKLPSDAQFRASTVRALDVNLTGYQYSGFHYKQMRSPNSFYYLPVSVNESTMTIKALGKWAANDTRTWGVYWNNPPWYTEPIQYNHLGVGAQTYRVQIKSGRVGDVYQININSETYKYTEAAGDSATSIATTLTTMIANGSYATALGGSPGTDTITFTLRHPEDLFTVSTSGTTTPANLLVTTPNVYTLCRVGPNSESDVDGNPTQVNLPKGPVWPWNFVGLFGVDPSYQFMFTAYEKGGTRYGLTAATQDSVDLENCFITVQGKLADEHSDIAGDYSATYANHYATSPYSDNSGRWALLSVNTVKLSYKMTVLQNFISSSVGLSVFRLWDINENGATSGQYGSVPFFYQLPGGPLTDAKQGIGRMPIQPGTIVGSSSGTHVYAMRIDNVSSSGFEGVSTSGITLISDSFGFSLGFTDLNSTSMIPAGATVTIDVTLLLHLKGLPVGPDSLIPSEAIRILKSADPIQATSDSVQKFTMDLMDQDIRNANDRLILGRRWIESQAAGLTTLNWNYAYSYDLLRDQAGVSDDDDSTYGEGHVLHGLVLRYLRTKDKSLVPMIENSVQYFLHLNQLAESRFGSSATGMMPYWAYPGPGTRTESVNGKTWTYQVGDPRAVASLEQSQMSTHGLWAYLHLLRNEDPTLFPSRQNVISLMERMQYFETSPAVTQAGWRADIPPEAQVVGNALHMATQGQLGTTVNNGVTAQYSTTYSKSPWAEHSPWYTQWMINNNTNLRLGADSNGTIIQFFRGLFAPDSTNEGLMRQLQSNAQDMVITDMGLHKDVTDSSTVAFGHFMDDYPIGWRPRENTLSGMYDASSIPTHYLLCNDAGARDVLFGKNPHYCLFLGFCAMYNPAFDVQIDQYGSSINIVDLFYQSLHVSAVHLMEPSKLVPRHGCSRFMGAGGVVADTVVDNCDLGYFMMAFEVYELVKARVAGTLDPSSYYRFPGTFTGFESVSVPVSGGPVNSSSADAVSVLSFGATGSGKVGQGRIQAGSTSLTVVNPLDFMNGQQLSVANAGTPCTIPVPIAPRVSLGGGSGGGSTYGYRIAALDGKGGCSAASAETLFNQASLTLTSMATVGYRASWLQLDFTFQSQAIAYAIYRTTLPQGSSLATGFIGVFSYNDTPFVDEGLAVKSPPPGIPAVPPSSPVADYLSAQIIGGGGTNTLTLSLAAVTAASNVNVYHEDSLPIQRALDSGQAVVLFPAGTYYCSNLLHVKTANQILLGDGRNSVVSFLWNGGCFSLENTGITFRGLAVDSNHQNNFCVTTENATAACHNVTVDDCYCTGSILTGLDILNQTTTPWEHVTIRNNSCVDTVNGYWIQGAIRDVLVVNNKQDYTDFNYSGRGVCFHNFPTGYVKYATMVGNVIRCGNHTAGVTVQGCGFIVVTGNVILTAGGVFGVYCVGDANYDEQTSGVVVTGNHFESVWNSTGIAVSIDNYKNVTVTGNILRGFGSAFEVLPSATSGGVSDSLTNGIKIGDNQLLQLDGAPIAQQQRAPLSVKYYNNTGLNPVGFTQPEASPPVSGTAYLNRTNVDITVYQQVYTAQNGTPGTVAVKVGPTSSPNTLYTRLVTPTSTNAAPDVISLYVPQGWYYQFATTGATLGTTTIMGQ